MPLCATHPIGCLFDSLFHISRCRPRPGSLLSLPYRNHLTRKSYYEEMYDTIIDPIIANLSKTSSRAHGSAPPVIVRYMESIMEPIAETNCSYWGTYLYGYIGHPPTIQHLNGRKETNTSFFLFTAKDSNEPTKSFKK